MDEKFGVHIFSKNEASARMVLPFQKTSQTPTAEQANFAGKTKPVLKDDIRPNKDEYLNTIFRAISQAYIESYAIDLRLAGVLEKAVPMFAGIKLFRNHILLTENIIGYVPKGWWDISEQFSAPGINVNPRLDMVLGWQEARQLLSDPPLLDSVSIGFNFKYKRSHEDMTWWMFYQMLGREVDGEVVRFIVTEITNVRELSFVWSGADELAKGGIVEISDELKAMLKDEGVELPEQEILEQREKENNGAQEKPVEETFNSKPETNHGGHIMSELIIKNPVLLAVKFGKQEIKDEAELQSLIDNLVSETASLKVDAANGREYLADLKEKAIAKAALVYGNGEEGYQASAELKSLIGKASLAELKELVKNYEAVLAKKLPGIRSSQEELDEPEKVENTIKNDDPKAEDKIASFNKKVDALVAKGVGTMEAVKQVSAQQ